MALIVKYKFQNVDANGNSVTLLPQFPSGVSYTKTDVVEGNITTRVIETDDLSKVTYIRFGCNESTYAEGVWEYLTEILDINISYVNTFNRMFRGCKLLNKIDVSNWDTSKVTSMSYMFNPCSQLTQLDVSGWNTSNVTDMSGMFSKCSQLTQLDVSNFDTSKVTNMGSMFANCSQLTQLDLSKWDTSNVTSMSSMFNGCQSLTSLNVSNFDTSKVINMGSIFQNCSQLAQLNLSKWVASKVTNMSSMFQNCSQLTQLDLSKWVASEVTNMQSMFQNCFQLARLDLSNFDTSNVTSMAGMFNSCSQLTQLDVSNFDTSKATNMQNMFSSCKVKNVGLIYCSKDTVNKLANCITSPCNFYVTNKTYTSPNPLVKYVMYREDKKQILYYNDETQTWEKPILSQWDSIEKHNDGKYYYHKRSGEVVLNGNENWALNSEWQTDTLAPFYCPDFVDRKPNGELVFDRFSFHKNVVKSGYECAGRSDGTATIYVNVLKSRLSTQDATGFKAWLQANPVTVVYQLAEEKVYECTDLDLITYADVTSLMVERGTIAPKTTLKIHQNIANITTILQEKVNVLENDTNTINSNINTINSNINTINTEIDNINTDLANASESIEGSWISVDSKDGYLKDIEILGNTIQNQDNLADIRSVGDKLENQELYEIPVLSYGKNLYNESKMVLGMISQSTGEIDFSQKTYLSYEYYIKVKPSTTYVANKPNTINVIFYYDKDKKYIGNEVRRTSFITPSNCEFMRFRIESTVLPKEFQLEEGTITTPYEPYQEHKLTILSPVQLERVGDVADRIVCKDGVWGVEKNIENVTFDGSEAWAINKDGTNTSIFSLVKDDVINRDNDGIYCISDKFVSLGADYQWTNESESISVNKNGRILIRIFKEKLTTIDSKGFKEWLQQNNICVKYSLAQPQFIPLPYDQQLKLRTFASKTNISFGCEIEPTLKASVPKSLSATVSTHTEQIDNLGKELDKVKKLEESVASTVTTESDFTTVGNTSNGYFEDVKLEGKTLVNLAITTEYNVSNKVTDINIPIKENCEYTVYGDFKNLGTLNYSTLCCTSSVYLDSKPVNGDELYLATVDGGKGSQWRVYFDTDKYIKIIPKTGEKYMHIRTGGATNGIGFSNLVILEGDHTQNPPSFFEGLKSVGQDVEQISVLSVKGDILDLEVGSLNVEGGLENDVQNRYRSKNFIENTTGYVDMTNFDYSTYKFSVRQYNENKQYITSPVQWESGVVMLLDTCAYFRIVVGRVDDSIFNAPKLIVNGKQDKKRILYYNDETQAWEKPVLREWDSIEKRGDKYYYIKRSKEVVLTGSEKISTDATNNVNTQVFLFSINTSDRKEIAHSIKQSSIVICNNFSTNYTADNVWNVDNIECISITEKPRIRISKSKASTVEEFKTWLQANPITVVYQLKEEKVYECTNLDLITYSGETNLLIKSGVLNPKVTLKVHQNITNIITILQNKVSVLENVLIQGLKQVLAGDMQSLAYMLYPEDFENIEQSNDPTDE